MSVLSLWGEQVVPSGVHYPSILRGQPRFRLVLGIGLLPVLYLMATSVAGMAILTVGYLLERPGTSFTEYGASVVEAVTPIGMLAQSGGTAALILMCWALMRALHGMRFGWLGSVRPGLRWRYLLSCLPVFGILLYGLVALTVVAGWQPLAWRPQPGVFSYVIVVVLVTPFQAAAEEFVFRGYLLQTLGALFTNPWVGVVLSSLVFAFLHGRQNLPLFLDRLVFGLLAAGLVLMTGGLEAAVAAHAVNNVGAYLLAGFTSSVAELRAIRELGWGDALLDVGGFALAAVGAVVIAHHIRLRRTTSSDLQSAASTARSA